VKFGDEQSVAEIQFLGVKEVVMLVPPSSAFQIGTKELDPDGAVKRWMSPHVPPPDRAG
jgi:hypothetical protein